ncbi:hypothetical protein O0I10_005120 [Lichtheimia ornata]|uniref:Borealin N-terminal domain-containing protein n=1 Tax=Lichtheimia ornata TaxID=688661 RepID=A0AAD7V4W7_9FUNG|nr:uncharacterized protein O0I10_005120 [Lichtheimia ornata]KAJ8659082.1 hypothetical protein O0I10_005120 [Lichtheimia ornata]
MTKDPDRILVREAHATIKKELHRRKQDIRQRTEFLIAALRAQCMSMVNELPASVRKMTMREFCHIYGADTALYLRQEAKRRMQRVIQEQHRPREEHQVVHDHSSKDEVVHQDEQDQLRMDQQQQQPTNDVHDLQQHSHDDIDHQPQPPPTNNNNSDHDQDLSFQLGPSLQYQTTSYDDDEPPMGTIFLHMDRQNHPRVRFQLDPLQSVDQLGEFSIDTPRDIIQQMTHRQRVRICQQIEDIQNKLENAKSCFEPDNE